LRRGLTVPARRDFSSNVLRPSYGLFIDGKETDAQDGTFIDVENPATGEIITRVAAAGEADVATAIASAEQAFEDGRWSDMSARERGRILNRAAELLRARIPDMAMVESMSTGRALKEMNAQLGRVPEWLEYHSALAQSMEGSVPPFSDPDHFCYVRRVPLGVCGLITPWNHPLLIANKKVAVALATGNTMVIKPPEQAPVAVILLAEILSEAGVPPGVVNVVNGYGAVAGKALVEHPSIAKVDLTGGTPTGQTIGALAGRGVKHYCAELGGNAPVLVFDDFDIDASVNGVAFAAFVASGQTCVSAKRILIQETIFDEFVAKLTAKANGIRLGAPQDLQTQMGPVVSQQQLHRVMSQVQEGIAEGAVALAGGKPPAADRCALQDGYFLEPTVLGSVSPAMSCFQEEIFGPVVTVMPFTDEDEAIQLANDSKYGLGGAVWTSNVARAHRCARKVKAGVFWVNSHHRNDPSAPWGGFKESGIGRENGLESFNEYTETQTVVIRTSDAKEDWFGDPNARYS